MKKQILTIIAGVGLGAALSAQAYIPNSGFETWGSTAGEDIQPTGYISYNIFTFSLFDPSNQNPTSVTQATGVDAYQGTYSAKITTVTLVNNPDPANIPNTEGFMSTGSVQFSAPYMLSGYATQQRPMTFTYAGKYAPVSGDTAFALVALTHWNGTSRDTIAAGLDYMTAAVSSYTVRTVNLVYNPTFNNQQPDTCNIFFSASFLAPHDGSAFYVDALAFTGYVGVEESMADAGISVYPNPSNSITSFDMTSENAATVVVFDMTGREVTRIRINQKHAELNAAELAAGSYSYTIIDNEGAPMNKGRFFVSN